MNFQVRNEITDYSKELNSIISYTDLQISDILHYIEFISFLRQKDINYAKSCKRFVIDEEKPKIKYKL